MANEGDDGELPTEAHTEALTETSKLMSLMGLAEDEENGGVDIDATAGGQQPDAKAGRGWGQRWRKGLGLGLVSLVLLLGCSWWLCICYQPQQSQSSAPTTEGNPKGRTHYEVLGISASATTAQIKKAYRQMTLKHHPDKGGCNKDFYSVQLAHDILSDDSSRMKYDANLRYGRF